ncbi:MAG: hypothetical protein CSA72_01950 [Rhodobacterales bacterium]|nr:MAG: hypothetical protein CSA72_01950 [Rhodobacterales bacterium]
MTRFAAIKRRFARLRRDVRGTYAMSLMVLMPLIGIIMGFAGDLGISLTRQVMLERAVDVQARSIRLGLRPADDYAGLRKAICETARIIPECETRLKLQLKAMSPYSWESIGATPDCESLKEVTYTEPKEFDTAQGNQLVVLRVCAVVEPFMPGYGVGGALVRTSDPDAPNRFYQVMATTAFVKEPS